VRTLAEIQAGIREALVSGRAEVMATGLGADFRPEGRLAIHQRHYAASLTRALIERFPASVWLVGSELVTQAAASFIRHHPPTRPCIAEYGESFPQHLGAHPGADSVPYLTQFAELEWHLGRLALATDDSPNVHYVHLQWSLDELIGIYLTDTVPERFALRKEDVWLEVRGLRGELEMTRLTADEFLHRAAAVSPGDGL